jgi:hypothetical protein
VVLSFPDDDSCESKHVEITIVESNYLLYLLCLLKINKLNTLTEHNGMDMPQVLIQTLLTMVRVAHLRSFWRFCFRKAAELKSALQFIEIIYITNKSNQ